MQSNNRYRKEKLGQSSHSNEKGDSRTKCLPWILLTVGIGLCIIGLCVYIIISLNSHDNSQMFDIDREMIVAQSHEIDYEGNLNFSLDTLGKLSNGLQVGLPQNMQGCHEASCRIECVCNANLYWDIVSVMNASPCEVVTSLMVSNQVLHSIGDMWIDSKAKVLKIVLMNSKITKIATGAFSTSMFAKVFHMSWIDLQLSKLSNGALLGLYSLRKLEIDFKLPNISMSFLQPVQVTLTHLRINAGISFKGNLTVFRNIYMEKLIHLDLSQNSFSGPLSKHIFSGTPNVTFLYLKYCFITSIEDDAFQDLADKLILVDLKHNLLTQIGDNIFRISGKRLLLDLEPNNWNCNCELRSMLNYYNENKSLFISTPYCRMPYTLYGKIFDELDPQELSCDSTMVFPSNITTETTITDYGEDGPVIPSEDTFSNHNYTEAPTNPSPHGAILQFSCSEAIDYANTDNRVGRDVPGEENKAYNSGTFVFEPPAYDLILDIFENYSVRAFIEGYQSADQLNIIWFSDDLESDLIRNASQTDYTCMLYEEPYLILDPLRKNRTYTFCMMPMDSLVISPLLCQPLYVPAAQDNSDSDEIWIPESEKQFTIAMLCLIFFISTVSGAIFAYLGIKSFPNLLEGSKNVLVVKEMDKECYISTITDSHNIKTPLSKHNMAENSFKIRNKKSFDRYDTNLPSLINVRPPSTCFEEPFTNMDFQAIGYEMPKQFKNDVNESCTINKCLDKPNSPPPLPKRNSNVSDYMDSKPKA